MKKTVTSLVCILTASSLFASNTAQPINSMKLKQNSSHKKTIKPYTPYKIILPILQKKVTIPVLLPSAKTVSQEIFQSDLSANSVFRATKNSYMVLYEWIPSCNGGPICTAAAMYASKIIANKKPPFNPVIMVQQANSDNTQKVKLANNITGIIEKDHRGTSVQSYLHTISWQQNGVLYQLTLNEYNKQDIITVANSAIKRGDWLKNTQHIKTMALPYKDKPKIKNS